MDFSLGEERQRLAELYRDKWDGELCELSADFGNLTETAQQVLRAEMMRRGLGEPGAAVETPQQAGRRQLELDGYHPFSAPAGHATGPEDDAPIEYTWKTLLCACDTREQAWQLTQALQRAGIESWVHLPGAGSRYGALDLTQPRVMVAADQLEQARAIAAQPIPQDIVDECRADGGEVESFEPPRCPECGAGEPVLEGIDGGNVWSCQACGHRWVESAGGSSGLVNNGGEFRS